MQALPIHILAVLFILSPVGAILFLCRWAGGDCTAGAVYADIVEFVDYMVDGGWDEVSDEM